MITTNKGYKLNEGKITTPIEGCTVLFLHVNDSYIGSTNVEPNSIIEHTGDRLHVNYELMLHGVVTVEIQGMNINVYMEVK